MVRPIRSMLARSEPMPMMMVLALLPGQSDSTRRSLVQYRRAAVPVNPPSTPGKITHMDSIRIPYAFHIGFSQPFQRHPADSRLTADSGENPPIAQPAIAFSARFRHCTNARPAGLPHLTGETMISELEDRIRERAHKIWEREGRPSDRAQAHWTLASAEIAAEAPKKPAPRPRAQKVAAAAAPKLEKSATPKPARAKAAPKPRAPKAAPKA
jgi:hypothetical protein